MRKVLLITCLFSFAFLTSNLFSAPLTKANFKDAIADLKKKIGDANEFNNDQFTANDKAFNKLQEAQVAFDLIKDNMNVDKISLSIIETYLKNSDKYRKRAFQDLNANAENLTKYSTEISTLEKDADFTNKKTTTEARMTYAYILAGINIISSYESLIKSNNENAYSDAEYALELIDNTID